MEAYDIAMKAVKAIDSKKGKDIEVIKIDELSILGDYLVIATGTSTTQVKALADEVDYLLGKDGIKPNHVEGTSSAWMLLDYGCVMVHVFHNEARNFYALERLWSDGEKIDISKYITE